MNKLNIITSFYISKYNDSLDSSRSKELETCLLNNISSTFVEKIHLFVDDIDSLNRLNMLVNDTDKIVVIDIGKKPKYYDYLKYIIDNLPNKICMITNSDIYIHQCDVKLINELMTNKIVYSLTRYEHDMSPTLINNFGGSHDCYIFNSSFLDTSILQSQHVDFYQNIPGIETRIISSFLNEGFKVYNPCYQIQIVHLHKTNLRNHGSWVGLHSYHDVDGFKKSVWCIPPTRL